jgi:sporulation protein YlmC with PRC-barrel domain
MASPLEVNLGARVRSSDGKSLGKVDELVVDADTNTLAYLVIDKGKLHDGRLVAINLIDRTDHEGVLLTVDKNAAEELPAFIREEFVQIRGNASYGVATGGQVDVGGTGNNWMIYGSSGGQYAHTGSGSLFMSAPIGNIVSEEVSSIEESDIVLSEGTRVVDNDGQTIGHIDEILFDEQRHPSGFIVRAGHLKHHEVRVPNEWVEGMAHDHIRLKVTKSFAEREGAQNPEA